MEGKNHIIANLCVVLHNRSTLLEPLAPLNGRSGLECVLDHVITGWVIADTTRPKEWSMSRV